MLNSEIYNIYFSTLSTSAEKYFFLHQNVQNCDINIQEQIMFHFVDKALKVI